MTSPSPNSSSVGTCSDRSSSSNKAFDMTTPSRAESESASDQGTQLKHVAIACPESQPAHEGVHRETTRQEQHQHPAHTELSNHWQETAGRQQDQLRQALWCGHRELHRQPTAVG